MSSCDMLIFIGQIVSCDVKIHLFIGQIYHVMSILIFIGQIRSCDVRVHPFIGQIRYDVMLKIDHVTNGTLPDV